jgi:hypothetical protein
MEWAFLALTPTHDRVLVFVTGLYYFVLGFNGSGLFAVAGRDKDATWRTLGTLCREQDWGRQRLFHALADGLPYRTIPPGYTIVDWLSPVLQSCVNIEASEISVPPGLMLGPIFDMHQALGRRIKRSALINPPPPPDGVTFDIEVQPPADEAPAPDDTEVLPLLDAAQWAAVATNDLLAKDKIRKGMKKAEVARLLEAESRKAVKAGRISQTYKASYLEDHLAEWGVWPKP